MNAREEMKRWLALLVQMADEAESKTIKQDADMLLAVASELTGKLAARNASLAKQIRPRSAKPPKASPVSGPQKQKHPQSSTDTPSAQNDAEDRPKELSRIQQGIRLADPSLADEQRALRGKVYGAQNDDVASGKAAKAIAR
jgi:hypothetical protein